MAEPSFSVQFTSAVLVVYPDTIQTGDLLVFDGSPTVLKWKKATDVNRTTLSSRSAAIALANYGGSDIGVIPYKDGGVIPAEISGLAAGTASWVRASTAGRIERVASPVDADDIVGRCTPDGRVNLMFGTLTATLVNGGSASVADDIAKSAGTTIDRVQGLRGESLSGTVPTDDEVWVKRGSVYVAANAMPKRWYDPRRYGAALDGVTDDIAAFEAMHDDMPTTGGVVYVNGIAWLSRTWRISKRIKVLGYGPHASQTPTQDSGFFVAPGYSGVQFDAAAISLDGGDAAFSTFENVNVGSRIMVHYLAGGSSGGLGINSWGAGQSIPVNDCRAAAGSVNPTKFFRMYETASNGGKGPATATALEPAWDFTVGNTTTDSNGNKWRCEKFPTVHATTTAYAVGDRVYAPSDNRFIWECEVAGTTAGTRPAQLLGGDDAAGLTADDTVTDGTVTWRNKTASGFRVHSSYIRLKGLHINGFTNCGVLVGGGTGTVAAGFCDANFFKLEEVYVQYVGMGVFLYGSDANGWRLTELSGINVGAMVPTPNTVTAAGYSGLGGHLVHENTQTGFLENFAAQTSSGRVLLKKGSGAVTALAGHSELVDKHKCMAGTTYIIGGDLGAPASGSVGVVYPDPSGVSGTAIREADTSGPVTLWSRLTLQDGYSATAFAAQESGDVNLFSHKYAYAALGIPAGLWALNHGNQAPNNAYFLYSAAAGLGYGPGWFGLPMGQLLGTPGTDTPVFDGRMSAIAEKKLRGGARKKGDWFRSQTDLQTILADGHRGVPWTTNTVMVADYTPWGICASVVEPTANTGKPGEQVWKCTTAGTTHATTEPTWPAAPTPGVTTQTDGSVTWTFLGYRPARVIEQRAEKARGPHYRALEVQTTTAAAGQLLDGGGVVNGEDLALPEGSMCRVSHLITVHKASSADGGDIEVKSTWVRNGSGAPAQIGSTTVTYNLSGATLDATTVTHTANGNRIELKCSPESADTLNWRVFRTQVEGVD